MSHRLPVADIQFISDFAAFCRTKGDEQYSFGDIGYCALAQYLRASGRCANPRVGGYGEWEDRDTRERFRAPFDFQGTPDHRLVLHTRFGRPKTFSALADRLEALIADAPEVERV